MSKKDRDKKERARQLQYESEKASVEQSRKIGPSMKKHLRKAGCDLPFYEFLDSFSDEFNRVVSAAREDFPTLAGIHEVDEKEFRNTDWSKLGVDPTKQIMFDLDDRFMDYSKSGHSDANIRGFVSFFHRDDGSFASHIVIPRTPICKFQHVDLKAVWKLAALLHELGHVHDAERAINLDPLARRFDVVEAEVYANIYALEQLAERYIVTMYNTLYEAIEALSTTTGYEGEVGRRVIQSHERRTFVMWRDYMEQAERSLLGGQ